MVSTPKSANITPHGGAIKLCLLDQVREKLRYRHYSLRTERAYVDWIRRFILFHQKRHPVEMRAEEIEAFLTHLAIERKVSASTQNFGATHDNFQAFCARLSNWECKCVWTINANIQNDTNQAGSTSNTAQRERKRVTTVVLRESSPT
jgi:Phage integrase, N-terminal SAM-like domain